MTRRRPSPRTSTCALSVTPPPLAPALERASHPRLHLFLIVAVLVAAGLAQLLGAPTSADGSAVRRSASVRCCCSPITMRAEDRLATKVDRTAGRGRAEYKTLPPRPACQNCRRARSVSAA